MEEIKFKDVKVGDYLKLENNPMITAVTEFWYIQVSKIARGEIWSKLWIDVDKGKFGIDRSEGFVNKSDLVKYYRLTEEEYYKIVGKFIILNRL
jgi:hypothetical protein